MAAISERGKEYQHNTDPSLVGFLKDAREDIRVSRGALVWAAGIAASGEVVRLLAKDSDFARGFAIGTRIIGGVLGAGGLIFRHMASSREDSVAAQMAERYGYPGHEDLTETVDRMDHEGHEGAIRVGFLVNQRVAAEIRQEENIYYAMVSLRRGSALRE